MALAHLPVPANSSGFPLGAARSSFVAHVHRKIDELQEQRVEFVESPDSAARVRARSLLIGELEVLAAGTEQMRIEAMASAVQEALSLVRRAPKYAKPSRDEGERLRALLTSLPTLAYRAGEPTRVAKPSRVALLVGMIKQDMATAQRVLSLPSDDGNSYECTTVDNVGDAVLRAGELLPDVILIDADSVDAKRLLGELEENVSEILPVVVMGSHDPGEHKEWLASGATRTLGKPFTPRELRTQVDELFRGERPKLRGALGTPTLGALRRMLADELLRAIASTDGDDDTAIPLGEGSEILGALWGAASRIREVITARTSGKVTFAAEGPDGTIAFAPSLDLHALAGRRNGQGRKAPPTFSLQGIDVVIADDDPAVVWFLADALRQVGANVHEAHDGKQALALAERVRPDLLITDILMPELDGLALSRRVHAHPLLAGTPVLLLSWKEDLLTKVRELGANAAGYLCKESDRGMVVFHAREALAPRVRLRARLSEGLCQGNDVHGRFDTLSPYALLDMLRRIGTTARVTVRDAAAHYEITVSPAGVWAVKTTAGGMLVGGERALTSLLGVRAGRFLVARTENAPDQESFVGALDEVGARYAAQVIRTMDAIDAHHGEGVRYRFDRILLAEYMKTVPTHVAHGLAALDVGAAATEVRALGPWLPETLHDLAARTALIDVQKNGVSVLASEAASVEPTVAEAPMASVKPAMEAPAPSATEAPAAEAAPEPRAEAPVAEPRVETQSASTQQVQSTSIDLTEPPPTFADPVLDAPELSQVSAPVAPVAAATIPPATTPSPSLELSPSPVSWSVEQALGDAVTPDPVVLASQDPSTEIDDVVYAPAEVQALAAEVHVCTAPDPTLYGGNDRVAANSIEPIAEPSISVHVQPIDADANPRAPSLIERAEARIASLAPAALDEPNAESAARKPKNKRSFFPIALFGAATGGAILLATLLSPDASNGKAAAGKPAPTIGDVPAGILEVDAKGQTVLVDGVPRGRGERVSVVLSQGSHTVGLEGHAETRQVEVRASEVVRVNGSEIFAEAKIPRTSTEQSKVNLEKLP